MKALDCLSGEFSIRLALTLMHFLWQAAALAVLVALAGAVLRKASASLRYGVFLAALGVMALCPAVTYPLTHAPQGDLSPAAAAVAAPAPATPAGAGVRPVEAARTRTPGVWLASEAQPASAAPDSAGTKLPPAPAADRHPQWQQAAPILTAAYLVGVAAMLARLLIGLAGGRRLRLGSSPAQEEAVMTALARCAKPLGLRYTPAVAFCRRVAVPVVVGILRPMVLLPLSLSSGLSPGQVEAVLTHELAHIRRYDQLANLFQRLVESFLFFHPAVWYVSRRVRLEREHCCDDLAVAAGGQPYVYAETLLHLAEAGRAWRRGPGLSQLAASGAGDRPSALYLRIARLLGAGQHEPVRLARSWPLAGVLLAAGAVAVLALAPTSAQTADPNSPAAARSAATPPDSPQLQAALNWQSNPLFERYRGALLKLRKNVRDGNFQSFAFESAIERLQADSGLHLDVKWDVLKAAGIRTGTQVKNVNVHDATVEKALRAVLDDVGGPIPLAWTVLLDDGNVVVSTKEDLSQPRYRITLAFNIGDLLAPPPSAKDGNQQDRAAARAQILELLTRSVDKDSWLPPYGAGKVGSITEKYGQLVVTQTVENQGAVMALLHQVREARERQECAKALDADTYLKVLTQGLATVKARKDELSRTLGANHRDVQVLQAQIEDQQKRIAEREVQVIWEAKHGSMAPTAAPPIASPEGPGRGGPVPGMGVPGPGPMRGPGGALGPGPDGMGGGGFGPGAGMRGPGAVAGAPGMSDGGKGTPSAASPVDANALLPAGLADTLGPMDEKTRLAMKKEAEILGKLQKTLSDVSFDNLELRSVTEWMAQVTGLNIQVKWGTLETGGITPDKKVRSLHLNDTTGERALRAILDDVGGITPLDFVVDQGVLVVSTRDDLSLPQYRRIVIYDIRDLIPGSAPEPKPQPAGPVGGGFGPGPGPGAGGGVFAAPGPGTPNVRDQAVERLCKLIARTIDKDSWMDPFGTGTVGSMSEFGGLLVIEQTWRNHQRVAELLADVRRHRPTTNP